MFQLRFAPLNMTKPRVQDFIWALNSSMASWISGSSLNDFAGLGPSALLGRIPSFGTNFTDQSRPVASFKSVSSCRRLLTLASASIFDLSSGRSEEHTSELQSRRDLVCRL